MFLDIEMGHINELRAAEIIRQNCNKTIIIFVSNFTHYVFDTFRVEVLHFLVKPIIQTEFNTVFNKAISKYKTLNSTISLKWRNERYVIKIKSNILKVIKGI